MLHCDLPKNAQVLQGAWVLKVKHFPDDTILKIQGQMVCPRRSADRSGHTFNTYAPVVGWSTVQTLLPFALQHQVVTLQVDFILHLCMLICPLAKTTLWKSQRRSILLAQRESSPLQIAA